MAARGSLSGGMAVGPEEKPSQPAEAAESAEASAVTPSYEPSIADVLVVKAMLNEAFALPPEIVYSIADFAEYWPHTRARLSMDGLVAVARGSSRDRENVFLVAQSLPSNFCSVSNRSSHC